MKFTLLPTAIRNLFVRHQAAATGAVFLVLVAMAAYVLWQTPDREVQAAPYHASVLDVPAFSSADPGTGGGPQVTFPSDSLKQRGVLQGMQRDTTVRTNFPQQPGRQFPSAPGMQTDTTGRRPARASSEAPRGVHRDSLRSDTLTVLTHADSVRIDSMNQVPRDSSARIEQFFYKRPTSVTAQPVAPRNYTLFLKQPMLVQTEVSLDSTGRYVIVRETVGGKDVKVPVRMPLAEYIQQRFKAGITKNYEDLVLKTEDMKKKDDLGDLLTSFTNIDIPVPANPVFSIFGPPRINLHISGAVDIRAAFRNTTTDQVTTSALGNSRNEPDFAQEVQINVSGTIGDKLNIVADWNTQRQFEYENQLKIKYTGYEDEIVQSVEAGNVSLPTNSRFISSSSALFGIKAVVQLGPLRLTGIASQKKGQVQEKTVTGGSSEVPFEKKAYDYSKDHFFVDKVYRGLYEDYVRKREVQAKYQIRDAEVWITNQGVDLTNTRKGIAYIKDSILNNASDGDPKKFKDLRADRASISGEIESGVWVKLDENKDYTIDKNAGYITMNRSTEGLAVAIAYQIEGDGTNQFIGTLIRNETGEDSTLVFKLVKPRNLIPQFTEAWSMMMKNFYPLGGRKIQKEGFSLDIMYRGNTGEPTPKIGDPGTNIIELFGLDNFTDGTPPPDGKFDYVPGITIDEERGEVIFPSLEPFGQGLKDAFAVKHITVPPADSFTYPEVYTMTPFDAQKATVHDRFVITGKTTAGTSNTINLGFNIVEGSVQVLLNGAPMVPNVDYTVDYIIGQVIIKNQAALVPGANMQVKFEQNDLFQLASKTLLGLRGDLNLSERTVFGFTLMNLDQQTLSDKVRLGEEPMKNSIYGIDGKTGADLPFLTKALDWLPFISTKEKSDISVTGEAAYMSPDPNTKKSPIPIDDGKSIAYIDDFEGAKRTIPLGVNYGMWHDASGPAYQSNVDDSISGKWLTPLDRSYRKGRAFWYNRLPSDVGIKTIYGDKKTAPQGQEALTVLNLTYVPQDRGEYNFSMNLKKNFGKDAPASEVRKNWAGIQRVISSSAVDLVRENVNFIELWVKVDKGMVDSTLKGKIYIDMGAISEDVIPNGVTDTEDKGANGKALPNGILNEGEDKGIDFLTDDEERVVHKDFLDANPDFPDLNNDPSGDNWSLSINSSDPSKSKYEGANGTEKNAASEIGKFPDTEDLNHNNIADLTNSYFEYELNLDTKAGNPQRVGGGLSGWYQYRIPLIDFKNKIGSPDFSLIEYVRVWATGFDDTLSVRLYDFNLVGNQWEELKKNDSTFVVSTINVEDNQNYISPPGVIRERDKSQTDANVFGNEQSLQLKVNHLHPGEMRHAIKRFTYKQLDVFNYKQLRMFVHGSPNLNEDALHPKAKLVVRFGRDSLNFYEYKQPIMRGEENPHPSAADAALIWKPENNVSISFAKITALKQRRDSSQINRLLSEDVPADDGPPGSTYNVQGNPDLTRIAFIQVGVENPAEAGTSDLSCDVWINELRLIDVDNTPGWAYSVSATLKLADLGSVQFTYAKQDPFFHQLETAFGSRMNTVNWNLSGTINLEKLLPNSWAGTSLPFTYSHTEGFSAPKYLPASDIDVREAANQQKAALLSNTTRHWSEADAEYEAQRLIFETQSIKISDSYALPSFRFSVPLDNWLVQDIINKMQFGFTYNTSYERAPQKEYGKSWSWQATFGYAYTFDPDLYLSPFEMLTDVPVLGGLKDLKVFFPITNFALKLAAARGQNREKVRNQFYANPVQRSFTSTRGFSFGWKLTENGLLSPSGDYSVDIASTLVHLETRPDSLGGGQRGFYSILSSLFMRDQFMSFGIDNSYSQNLNINLKPRLPEIFEINKFLTLSARYGVGYSWSNNLQLGELGKSTRWTSNISMGSDLSLKQFVESWWHEPKKEEVIPGAPQQTPGAAPTSRRRNRDDDDTEDAPAKKQQREPDMQIPGDTLGVRRDSLAAGHDSLGLRPDSLAIQRNVVIAVKDTTPRMSLSERLEKYARIAIKIPLLDFEKINMSFTQMNSSSNAGVPGRPGFANFFGKVPFMMPAEIRYGPSWAYQMGFTSDPTANLQFTSKFPFIGVDQGDADRLLNKRATFMPGNSSLPEAFQQNNKLSFKTNRELWEGARIDLNWTVGWDYSKTQNIRVDSSATSATISGLVTGGSIERSFFFLPFKSLSGIEKVSDLYTAAAGQGDNPEDKRNQDQKLSEAFEKGFETLPFLRQLFGQFMPRMNYSFRWDGLEKYSVFTSWATRVSLDHAYQSSYKRTFRSPSGVEVTESQRVTYGFAPLLGLSITFKELLKGNMSANVRYSSSASYDLSPSSKNIAETGTREISFTASYGRTGFEIPLFGLALNNDVDISMNYTYAKNSRQSYSTATTSAFVAQPGEGSSRTTMEPRIKYVLSARVTASLFYRYTKVAPDEGGSRIPGSSTNEGGVDVHIAIQ
ncbi:MAG TPA: cell surface protein SprA [Bacteroidota bacterium]|nr:cell surface protein SprA [Bacteroidota bacterium]